uniref:DDT domain-containing protein n=1 Tax=Caenorhabditis tropicalis TaxID=1561998 RepID=A0A1I7TYY9_9PELO
MPLLNKQSFEPRSLPNGIVQDTQLYYCKATKELFLNHEEYFTRMMMLNTTVWSCSLTRKSNLTYFEAIKSEQEAETELLNFPESLERPILFIVQKFTNRGRFEELVNDVYHIMKDRYFTNEEVYYTERNRKLLAQIITSYTVEEQQEIKTEPDVKEPVLLPADAYRYTIKILGIDSMTENMFRENVTHDNLFRSKNIGARHKIRLLLKNCCYLPPDGDRYTVRDRFIEKVSQMWWSDVMSGTEPVCPQTPVQQRGRVPNLLIPGLSRTQNRKKKNENDDNNAATPRRRGRPPQTPEQRALKEKRRQFQRRSEAGIEPEIDEFIISQSGALTLTVSQLSASSAKKKVRKSSASLKNGKKKAKIQEQQEDLDFYFNEARRLGVDISGLEQDERLLSPKIVANFKRKVREEKEAEKELMKEERKRKIKEKAAYNKKREDLICNDLKPMPKFPALELPSWMTNEEFEDYLFILQFFSSFKDILPLKEIRGSESVLLSDVILAIRCGDPQSSPFADLMRVLLSIRTDITDEEDGDEADINNREEMYLINTQNCDPINLAHGDSIKEISDLHQKIRKIYGKSVRHLPVDWMTLTEVLRLIFATSGYYTGISTHRHRLYARGNFRGYEDPAYELRMRRPDIISKLRTQTVFDLEPSERMEIVKAIIYQLLTYSKLRGYLEKSQNDLNELKKEQKKLKTWDAGQEGEANAARLVLELDTLDFEKKESPVVKIVKSHIKAHNEGRRYDKNDLDTILLDSVPYSSLTLDEIIAARELQKAEVKIKLDIMSSKTFAMHCKVSDIRLGSDRAYRRYIVMENISAILVENPTTTELCINCDEPSRIDDENNLREDEKNEVFLCSGQLATCLVHGLQRNNRYRWCYIESRDQFQQLLNSLNPRGNREIELLEYLNEYRLNLLNVIEKTEQLKREKCWEENLMTNIPDPADTYNIDWDTEMRDLLLDFEEKLDQGLMGSIEKVFKINRSSWRESLRDNGDVVKLLEDNNEVFDQNIIDIQSVSEVSTVKKLAIAFFMIVRSINLKFIKPPYISPTKDERGNLKPSELFNRWQSSLLQCESHSALSLFITTFEGAIKWDKSRLQGKCKSCRRKAFANELVLCTECDSCYHLKCAKVDLKLDQVISDYMCIACKAHKRKLENEARRKNVSKTEDSLLASMSIDEHDSATEVIDEASTSSLSVTKTASGRSVKKIHYLEVHEGLNLKARKSNEVLMSSTPFERAHRNEPVKVLDHDTNRDSIQEDEHDSDGENTRKRKLPSKRSLTAKNNDSPRVIIPKEKEKMSAIEQLLKEAMRQECSWPFLQPVDVKEVPDYYDVIKRPMDLRTMMNKIKQRVYNKPAEVGSDFRLLLSNCETYNETESEIYQLSKQLDSFVTTRLDNIIGSR